MWCLIVRDCFETSSVKYGLFFAIWCSIMQWLCLYLRVKDRWKTTKKISNNVCASTIEPFIYNSLKVSIYRYRIVCTFLFFYLYSELYIYVGELIHHGFALCIFKPTKFEMHSNTIIQTVCEKWVHVSKFNCMCFFCVWICGIRMRCSDMKLFLWMAKRRHCMSV